MRIGVDVDEVLGEFLRSMLPWLAREHDMRVAWEEMHTYEFYKAWGVEYGRARELIDRFLESDAFKHLDVVPGSRRAIDELAGDHDVYVVTSRPEYVAGVTRWWLDRHYPGFDEVLFTNQHGFGEATTKHALVEEYGLDVHVDDSPGYASNVVREAGRPAVLFNKPWNVTEDVPRGVHRVDSWDDALCVLTTI